MGSYFTLDMSRDDSFPCAIAISQCLLMRVLNNPNEQAHLSTMSKIARPSEAIVSGHVTESKWNLKPFSKQKLRPKYVLLNCHPEHVGLHAAHHALPRHAELVCAAPNVRPDPLEVDAATSVRQLVQPRVQLLVKVRRVGVALKGNSKVPYCVCPG